MRQERYHQLLSRLLDSELTADEAQELATGLQGDLMLREDLRRQLVLWEAWSQRQSAERSAEAFARACRVRLRIESEAPEAFAAAVLAKLGPSPTRFEGGRRSSPFRATAFVSWGAAFLAALRGWRGLAAAAAGVGLLGSVIVRRASYELFVTNEASGDITVINPASRKVVATIQVGKRPRAIQVGPDARAVFVAVSGTPVSPPPELNAQRDPIFKKDPTVGQGGSDEFDRSADGIAMVAVEQRKLIGKLQVGSNPEQFALSADGTRIYLPNEDAGAAMFLNVSSGLVEHMVALRKEPEGIGMTPDGRTVFITCEGDGEIFAIEAATGRVIAHIRVGGRPRSVAFLPDGSRAFIPSESAGQLHVIDCVSYREVQTVELPRGFRPMCIKVGPGGRKAYLSGGRSGEVVVLDARTSQILKSIKVGSRPWGLAISPDGAYLYTANGFSEDVSIVDLSVECEVGRIKVGARPWGVAVVPRAVRWGLRDRWPWSRNQRPSAALLPGGAKFVQASASHEAFPAEIYEN